MTTKEYLLQANRARQELRNYEDRLEELRASAGGLKAITYDKDKVQVSPSDVLMESVVKLISMEEEYAEQLVRCHRTILRITDQINKLPNPDHSEILRLRYLTPDKYGRLPTMKRIARMTNRSFDRTIHLHGEALRAFWQKYLQQ